MGTSELQLAIVPGTSAHPRVALLLVACVAALMRPRRIASEP